MNKLVLVLIPFVMLFTSLHLEQVQRIVEYKYLNGEVYTFYKKLPYKK